MTNEEQNNANKVAMEYSPFVESMKKRKLKVEEIVCLSFVIGWFGQKQERRIVKVRCYSMEDTINFYMRPIEGVTVTVDLDEMKVVGFIDRVEVPIPKAYGTDYREEKHNGTTDFVHQGFRIIQPNGAGFTIDNDIVR